MYQRPSSWRFIRNVWVGQILVKDILKEERSGLCNNWDTALLQHNNEWGSDHKKRSMDFYHYMHHWNSLICKSSFQPWSKYQPDALSNLQAMWIGKLKSTTMIFLIADKSIQNPVRILYDTLVKVDRLNCPTNFIILDCNVDVKIPIILGRNFLENTREFVDIKSGKLKFRVNDNEVSFNLCKSLKQPSDIHETTWYQLMAL